ncbi:MULTISPECIES: hypothetical protein [Clostridium]|uniref:Uncharacterized protein n=1 Tax=Clostridium botulinum B2 450 TaxID=1379739 RepID=A0A0D1C1D5_CLOBO|nr:MULTISPECIES: hypothetical protein [Clostridium]KIS24871.1 hypothetical protein N495_15265 [Clostridium botulinum B2 450]MBO0530374.1 hypothetical protein [Clostridium botulinum]MBO0538452.1 hypothetical protein [Clostridium botulinum]MBO0554887.1 hypothetical protein [Clostridium botulinum]MBO0558918.1 hypothetical protein [Clostridium botulinum]
MEEQMKEVLQRIDYLEKLINTIQNNINSNMQLFVAMLALVVALVSGAIFLLVKYLVNKRVDTELIKMIEKNPPTLYYQGILNKIYSVCDDKHNWFSEGIISVDLNKFNIKSLEFPIQLDLFYFKDDSFKMANRMGEREDKKVKIKVDLKEYEANLENNCIKINYKDFFPHKENNIFWTLKIPNPKYKTIL